MEETDIPPVAEPKDAPSVADEVVSQLSKFGATDDVISKIKDELGVDNVADLALLTEQDFVGVGMKPVPVRKLMAELAPVAVAAEPATVQTVSFDILPAMPDDESWLRDLQTGGILKVEQSTVIAAVRAALANQVGMYDIPNRLVKLMEEFAESYEEPLDASYFSLRKQLTRRSYADIFAAIDGLDSSYVTEKRKQKLFNRIDNALWPAIASFNSQLKAWVEAWMQGAANPSMIMMSMMSGSAGNVLPPGVMQPPDTGVLRDQADAVADAINYVFASDGLHIASALAYEASEISKTLSDRRMPALIGEPNKEQMLKKLGVSVQKTSARLETNLTRYVLACMQVKEQPAGNEELQYFSTLYTLGSQIPWQELGIGDMSDGYSGVGGRTRL